MSARAVRRATAVVAGTLAVVMLGGGTAHAAVTPAQRALLTRVGILQGDLAPGYTARLAEEGESLKWPTLDNCNFRFTTEAQRLGRREIEIVDDANGEMVNLAGETAIYKTPAAAAKALVEWRTSVARCKPLTWVSAGLRLDSETNRVNRSLPVADNVDTNILMREKGSKTPIRVLIIGQRKGAVVSFVFVYTSATPDRGDVAALRFFSSRTGARLAAAVR